MREKSKRYGYYYSTFPDTISPRAVKTRLGACGKFIYERVYFTTRLRRKT